MGNCVFIIPVSETENFSFYYKDFKILQCTQSYNRNMYRLYHGLEWYTRV